MKKKLITLALILVVALPGCGQLGGSSAPDTSEAISEAQVDNTETTNKETPSTHSNPSDFSLYSLTLELQSEKNAAFSKYDMDVYLDDNKLYTLSNGEKFTTTVDVSSGNHELKVTKSDDSSFSSSDVIEVKGNTTIVYNLGHDRKKIEIQRKETKIDDTPGKQEEPKSTTEITTEAKSETSTTEQEATESAGTTESITTKDTENNTEKSGDGISPEFKEAMDSYEAFFDEYVEFMKKYQKSPDAEMLAEYNKFMMKYNEYMEKIDKIDESKLTKEENDYYIEVMNRVNKKLLEVTY